MAEYWKSIPKYFCKYCQSFVTDTQLIRREHEQSFKHRNALKRFMNEIHSSNLKRLSQTKENPPSIPTHISESVLASYEKPKTQKPKIHPAKKKSTLDDWEIPDSTQAASSSHNYIPTQTPAVQDDEPTNLEKDKEQEQDSEEKKEISSLKRNRESVENEEKAFFHFKVRQKSLETEEISKDNTVRDSNAEEKEPKVIFKKKRSSARQNLKSSKKVTD
ncbi:U2-type precatalytic spliceosome WW domain-binding protein Wbp4 [Schizosaccharomyces osmophilus]|uniref:U2-type precatalytic spliceosome WW domain-binding protein Wbp4 n=1 Tax=Schizosaccharomyces osmophilus TaxID=2545709 RepID=A0AAE9WCH5_9SCHI|nr:U2-type precatalytic spliceosome WW domain-binding protein Wbp4 [Schizosaccharomyces osmophilus]WBW73811.1 U2-type precatalytic spliceosome WW domain-binding protein Wbp4 [Schizosaccharomyces osmophilus]